MSLFLGKTGILMTFLQSLLFLTLYKTIPEAELDPLPSWTWPHLKIPTEKPKKAFINFTLLIIAGKIIHSLY